MWKLVLCAGIVADAEVEASPKGLGPGDGMSSTTNAGKEPDLMRWDVTGQHVPEINWKSLVILFFASRLPQFGCDFWVPDLQDPFLWILVLKHIVVPTIRNCLVLLHRGGEFLEVARLRLSHRDALLWRISKH